MPTWDEAIRCPKCGETGTEKSTTALANKRGHAHFLVCENRLCVWFDSTYMVQTLPDGTIPVRAAQGPGSFPTMSQDMIARGRRVMEDIMSRDLRGTDLDR